MINAHIDVTLLYRRFLYDLSRVILCASILKIVVNLNRNADYMFSTSS